MPTYEYRCLKCKKNFDLFQPITDQPIKKCKYCSGKVERVIGVGGGIIFKGSGFYATDYRSSSYKDGQKQESKNSCPAKTDGCKNCPKAKQE